MGGQRPSVFLHDLMLLWAATRPVVVPGQGGRSLLDCAQHGAKGDRFPRSMPDGGGTLCPHMSRREADIPVGVVVGNYFV